MGRKSQRANKYRTWIPMPDGEWLSKELAGPPNHTNWKAIWNCFVTMMTKLTASRELMTALEAYEENIESLVTLWGVRAPGT